MHDHHLSALEQMVASVSSFYGHVYVGATSNEKLLLWRFWHNHQALAKYVLVLCCAVVVFVWVHEVLDFFVHCTPQIVHCQSMH